MIRLYRKERQCFPGILHKYQKMPRKVVEIVSLVQQCNRIAYFDSFLFFPKFKGRTFKVC